MWEAIGKSPETMKYPLPRLSFSRGMWHITILQDKVGRQIPGTALLPLYAISQVFSLAEPTWKPEARRRIHGIHAGQPLSPESRVERVESWSAGADGGHLGNGVIWNFLPYGWTVLYLFHLFHIWAILRKPWLEQCPKQAMWTNLKWKLKLRTGEGKPVVLTSLHLFRF